mgnify:CR=1 FL=1
MLPATWRAWLQRHRRRLIGLALVVAFMAVLIFIRHRANIARIRTGTEPRIGKKT